MSSSHSRPVAARILAVASYLPEQKVSNADLTARFPDWSIEKILEKTGIESRALAAEGECSSDLGFEAARRLFAKSGVGPGEIDFLLFCTQSPDYFLPTTACLLQDRLGLPRSCGALDFNLGCSGFVYGLSLAKGLVETGAARKVLLITAETYSKFIHPKDKSLLTIFGDGASATLIGAAETSETADEPIGPFVFGTDGKGADNLIVPAGGFRTPRSPETSQARTDSFGNTRSPDHLYMNGSEIMIFTLREVPAAVNALLAKAGIALDEVDYFVFHQANQFMLESLRKKLKIPNEKFCIGMKDCGNTVSATIPMAFEKSQAEGRIRPGSRVMLVGFGVGYSWAAALVRA